MSTFAEAIARAASQLGAAGVEDARLEAELLLAHTGGTTREHLIAALHDPLDEAGARDLARLLARRLRREPLAYIIGHREFYGLDLLCAPGALIPRPETELVVDLALAEARVRRESPRIVDVGTGSGAIACALAMNAPGMRVLAVDSSAEALTVAAQNVGRLGLGDRVELRRADLLDAHEVFDVILANLPYVSEDEWARLKPEVRDFEPKEALVPGLLGTEANLRLLTTAREHLRAGGVLALEIGATQAATLCTAARAAFPTAHVSVKKDLAGLDRMLVLRVPESL